MHGKLRFHAEVGSNLVLSRIRKITAMVIRTKVTHSKEEMVTLDVHTMVRQIVVEVV